MSEPKLFPVQAELNTRKPGAVRESVYMRAYEVYCHMYGPQEAMITGNCRGGFATGEIVVFLYAHSFPQNEWRARVDEAFEGMNV